MIEINPVERDAPVYRHSYSHALGHQETEQYLLSYRLNWMCKGAIDEAISQHFQGNSLNREAADQVIRAFGLERTMYVLANTVQMKNWDGRFSKENKEWADAISICPDPEDFGQNRKVIVKKWVVHVSQSRIWDTKDDIL